MSRIAAISSLVLVLFAASPAPAQLSALPAITPDGVLWQARSCVGETRWDDEVGCIAMAWVHAKRATAAGVRFSSLVRRYSWAVKRHAGQRRPWLLALGAHAEEPTDWPEHLPWARYRPLWLRTYHLVRRWAGGAIPDPCPEAQHYGGRGIDSAPPGWVEVDCAPGSAQVFWRPRE